MPLTFPLSLADFIDRLPIKSIALHCPEVLDMSRTGGGEILTNDAGARLWQGKIALGRLDRFETSEAMALIDLVRGGGGRSFYVYDTRHPAPRDDPDGATLGASNVQIRALGSDNRTIQLKGLPAGYVLRRGDMLSFDYASNPVRTALHRVVETSIAAGGQGNTGDFEVVPNIRVGAAVNDTVRLVKPYCKALLVPGSVDPGTPGRFMTDGIAFDVIQTLAG